MQRVATQEMVDKVADEMVARGINPTIRPVLAKVGGGFTLVREMLGDWRARRSEGEAPVALPDELLEKGASLVRDIYIACQARGQEKIDTVRRDANEKVDQAGKELKDALDEVAALEERNTKNEQTIAELRAEAERLLAKIKELEMDKFQLETRNQANAERIASLEGELRESQSVSTRLEQLESTIKTAIKPGKGKGRT